MQELVAKKMIMHMSTINSNTTNITNEKENSNNKEDDLDVALPGFRFHPTDEELVGFYLRRKVEKKPISIELIKQIDIYKYDPWDLPKVGNVGDKEWYFFCIRGRKYRNSIRPNRVTGSGFWKATGIDKPIYSAKEPHDCIGLKKSLVYYRGSAGKGTKTDWMMHEFRLPLNPNKTDSNFANASKADNNVDVAQEAEVWTLCRIFKRISSYKKYSTMIPADHNNNNNGKESSTTLIKSSSMSLLSIPVDDSSSKTCSLETDYVSPCYVSLELDSDHHHHHHHLLLHHDCYQHHDNMLLSSQRNKRSKPVNSDDHPQSLHDSDREASIITHKSWFNLGQYYNNNHVPHTASHHQHQAPIMCPGSNYPSYYPSFNLNPSQADHDFFTNESWDELRSVVQFAVDRHPS